MIAFLIILFGLSMLLAAVSSRIDTYIKILAFQGFLLFLLTTYHLIHGPWLALLLPVLETLIVKTVLIPGILLGAVRKNGIYREIETGVSNLYSMAAVSLIFLAGFFLTYWSMRTTPITRHLDFGISLSVMAAGLFLIMTRKAIIIHIMGFMMCENGLFLLSLSVGREMPLLINLGILLDIFIGIYLLLIFFNRIHSTFDGIDIDQLTTLKD